MRRRPSRGGHHAGEMAGFGGFGSAGESACLAQRTLLRPAECYDKLILTCCHLAQALARRSRPPRSARQRLRSTRRRCRLGRRRRAAGLRACSMITSPLDDAPATAPGLLAVTGLYCARCASQAAAPFGATPSTGMFGSTTPVRAALRAMHVPRLLRVWECAATTALPVSGDATPCAGLWLNDKHVWRRIDAILQCRGIRGAHSRPMHSCIV